jgi:hypothetical protein
MQGVPVVEINAASAEERLEFIEDTLAYRLPWALEAVRVRKAAHESANPDPWALTDPGEGLAVAAVEAGTLNRSAALLQRAGFPTRSGALAAVQSANGHFETLAQLHQWLNFEHVRLRTNSPDWPTVSAHELWCAFVNRTAATLAKAWVHTVEYATAAWSGSHTPKDGTPYRALSLSETVTVLETADAEQVGVLGVPVNPRRAGLLTVTGTATPNIVELSYRGPSDLKRAV